MKIIRTFIFPLLFLFIIFLILELISIKLFPEYSQNQIFKTNFKTEKGFSRISKSKIQHFHYFKNLKTRSKKNSIDNVYNENLSTIWLFGDSVTNGYGLKYTDTYYHSLEMFGFKLYDEIFDYHNDPEEEILKFCSMPLQQIEAMIFKVKDKMIYNQQLAINTDWREKYLKTIYKEIYGKEKILDNIWV